jgi:hypothetical protein
MGVFDFPSKYLSVGNPLTPYFWPSDLCSVRGQSSDQLTANWERQTIGIDLSNGDLVLR